MSNLTISETLFLLRDRRRRYVIEALKTESPIDIPDLADSVAAMEHGDDYTEDERKAVYVSLKQTHVPALDDYDVVDYRDLANVVATGPEFDTLTQILTSLSETLGEKRPNTDETAPPER